MTDLIGIIANPASGKDIRRLVAHGSVFENHEKVNIIRRVLLGLDALGIRQVLAMGDAFGLIAQAKDGLEARLTIETLDLPITNTAQDSTEAAHRMAAAGAGLRNYVTDLWFANTGATTTLVTLTDSAGSVLGYTIAPTVSGSNLPGLITPIRTGANASFNIQAGSNTSTLYATVKGFKAP